MTLTIFLLFFNLQIFKQIVKTYSALSADLQYLTSLLFIESKYLQLRKMNVMPLVNKTYGNEVTLNDQNLYQKSCQTFILNLYMLKRVSSFERGTVGLCRSIGCKVTTCQSWSFEKNSAAQPESSSGSPGSAEQQNFFQSSNFDRL